MNWVGGVRKRIQLNDSRKQEEGYFVKRRMEERQQPERPGILKKDQASSSRYPECLESLSQDLIALQTLIQSDARRRNPSTTRKATEVKLDKHPFNTKYKMKTPQHCKLPESPIKMPSALLLSSPEKFSVKPETENAPQFRKPLVNQIKPIQLQETGSTTGGIATANGNIHVGWKERPPYCTGFNESSWKAGATLEQLLQHQHMSNESTQTSNVFLTRQVQTINPFCIDPIVYATTKASCVTRTTRSTHSTTTTTINRCTGFLQRGEAETVTESRSQQTQTEDKILRDAASLTEDVVIL